MQKLFLSSTELNPENLPEITIGIAGAGISGLIAGRQLQKAGFQVTVFEARARTGGRIHSLKENGYIIETGPEFIHGKLKETLGLLKEYRIKYEPIDGRMYHSAAGRIRESYEMTSGWDLLLEKMGSLREDQPLYSFLETYFPEKQYDDLRKSAIRFAEGFDLADSKTASTRALHAEWEHEDAEQYRIPEGYGTLIQAIENDFVKSGGKIFLNHAIEEINWSEAPVKIRIHGGQEFETDKLLISLPVSLLNAGSSARESIRFNPAPAEHLKAVSEIGFGTVIKVITVWKESFWKKLVPDAQFIFSDSFIPTWWTQIPLDIPMLTGWLGGPAAEKYSGEPDEFILGKAMESLSAIFTMPVDELKKQLKDHKILNWKNEPWTRGAYSYSKVGYKKDKSIYRSSLQNRIYFTGEAGYDGPYPGTVEAAITSGLLTARQLEEEMRNKLDV